MSLTKITKEYVYENAYIKKAIETDTANYSKVARKIIIDKNLNKNDFDAIVVALRRLKSKRNIQNKNINLLLSDSSVEIKSKMAVYILEKNTYYKNILELEKDIRDLKGSICVVEGIKAITFIASQEYEKIIHNYFKNNILKQQKNLIQITLTSPETLENIPGVIAYLCGLFAEEEINLVETLSCWTDTIFIIEEKDINKAIKILKF